MSQVPESKDDRFKWLYNQQTVLDGRVAGQARQQLVEKYGKEAGEKVRYAEAFEVSEYGRQITPEELNCIFP